MREEKKKQWDASKAGRSREKKKKKRRAPHEPLRSCARAACGEHGLSSCPSLYLIGRWRRRPAGARENGACAPRVVFSTSIHPSIHSIHGRPHTRVSHSHVLVHTIASSGRPRRQALTGWRACRRSPRYHKRGSHHDHPAPATPSIPLPAPAALRDPGLGRGHYVHHRIRWGQRRRGRRRRPRSSRRAGRAPVCRWRRLARPLHGPGSLPLQGGSRRRPGLRLPGPRGRALPRHRLVAGGVEGRVREAAAQHAS
jgi:hypothetical protein